MKFGTVSNGKMRTSSCLEMTNCGAKYLWVVKRLWENPFPFVVDFTFVGKK